MDKTYRTNRQILEDIERKIKQLIEKIEKLEQKMKNGGIYVLKMDKERFI
ncbi:MAG TPA: hypothetical protein P5293_05855 [Bacteroidales bacterium]|nr:hypothetical protein [Bacteroidales bacterium]